MTLTPASLTIRSAKHWDAVSLSQLATQSYADAFGHSMTREELDWQLRNTKSVAFFSERIATDAILLAISNSRMVGYVHVGDVTLPIASANAADQQLNALYIAREFQGRGIGTRLMRRALKLPRVLSAPSLYLDVWDENEKALRFYRRLGFQVIGQTDFVVNSRVIGKDLIMLAAMPKQRMHGRAKSSAGAGQV